MSRKFYKVLVIGIGNTLMSDDGVGIVVISELMKEKWPDGVFLIEAGNTILNFFYEIMKAENLILIDATKNKGSPGEIYRINLFEISCKGFNLGNAHGGYLPELIFLAKKISGLPKKVVVYGIEPQKLNMGYKLSEPVSKALPFLYKKIKGEIKALLKDDDNSA